MSLQTVERSPSSLSVPMERILKSQVAKMVLLLSFLSLLLLLIPFVSTSLRSSYLYFLLNLLILVLGAEAGLLASVSEPNDEKKPSPGVEYHSSSSTTTAKEAGGHGEDRRTQEEAVTAVPAEKMQKMKRCRSRPSIFFIGSCDEEEAAVEEKEAAAAVPEEYSAGELVSKQELFMKAEMFIGNFYKQLKMQREESWKKIHGLYHSTF